MWYNINNSKIGYNMLLFQQKLTYILKNIIIQIRVIEMKVKKLFTSALTILSVLNLSLPVAVNAEGEASQEPSVIISSDFEDGDAGRWQGFGNCVVTIDPSNGYQSTTSLKTTDRGAAFEGPSLDGSDILQSGAEYFVDGWVYLYGDIAHTISYTLKTQDSYGVDNYSQIATSSVSPNEWVNISGSITLPEDTITSLIYVECDNGTVEFSIDDFSVSGEAAFSDSRPVEYKDKIIMDFERDFEGWSARGDMTVAHTDEYSKTGTHSIYSTSRTQTWNAPMVNISTKVKKGESYYYSAYIMYNGAEYENSHIFRMELQYSLNGNGVYNLISDKTVKKGKWTKIEGFYTIPENAQNTCLYIQTDNVEGSLTINDTMSYYVDNVIIAKASVINKEQNIRKAIIAVVVIIVLLLLFIAGRTVYIRVKKKNEALELVSKDAMTGTYNRNAYEQRIKELAEDEEQYKNLYYALCDVNFLKYLNDNHGHKTGDAAIIRCAEILKAIVGKSGKVYRIGGDEFVCMSENSIAEKILEATEKESGIDKGYPFMVACGFAQYDEKTPKNITEIIAQCDKEMYAHKQKIKAENQQFSRK